ncbi:hypothetical protein [Actinoplanes sp. NPDC049599]|uniref:hypothetical protein n=1 Tax=Actinoplanes sp. NPDC049599 TaxID=3363903 RepID=UPI0037A0031A
MSVQRGVLAWYRRGLVTAVTGTPTAGTARAGLPARLTLNGAAPYSGPVPVQLAGPGDVVALDPAEIRRCEPYDGCSDFEPEYLAYVELASADLPWRFSPLGPVSVPLTDPEHPGPAPGSQTRLAPWLALVVVPQDAAQVTPAAPGGLPILICAGSELPDPSESWAWAHVQVDTSGGVDAATAAGDRSRSVARLLCPRRLESGVAYRALLVPTFAGGLGAVGLDLAGRDPLAPAWDTTGEARLPVYFSFGFSTGEASTFETLARRLRPRGAPPTTGGRTIAVHAPGWGVVGPVGSTVLVQGALRPLGPPTDAPADPALAAQLATAISAGGTGLQLRPPIYGQDYASGRTTVNAAERGWLSELNTDPRRRLAAGLGAWVVAVLQEELVDQAWKQLAAAGSVPSAAADPELAGILTDALYERTASTTAGVLPGTLARSSRAGGPIARTGTALAPALRTMAVTAFGAETAPDAGTPAARFAPDYDDPAHALLAGVCPEWLLPGVGDVAEDSLVVMRTNPAFIEAFLIGLNHALARELAWRRFPLRQGATMVRRFWTSTPGAADNRMRAVGDWDAASGLGTHTPGVDELVLLIRGSLLRRFPTAAIYLAGVGADGTERHVTPSMSASLGPGTAFFGFPVTATEALSPSVASGVSAWWIVLQEAVDHARYGLDGAPTDGSTAILNSWADLDWAHPHVAGHTHLPVDGPLAGVARGLRSAAGGPKAVWGADSAQLAAALTRPAIRVRISVSLWLKTPNKSVV